MKNNIYVGQRSLHWAAAGLVVLAASVWAAGLSSAGELALTQTQAGYDVLVDGKPFASYVTDFRGTPIIWPIFGPTGKKMTRDFPMIEHRDKSEAKDHPHHRSLWFSHGVVNAADFWLLNKEKIVHRQFTTAQCDGEKAILVTENDWMDKDNTPICTDRRAFCFSELPGKNGPMRCIDFDITVTAVQENVVFGDSKEGTFGMRVPGSMDVTAKKRHPQWGGHIVNSKGDRDQQAWGTRSEWVDYFGPVEDEALGIAILNHPSSFRYPTYWHARDYGLFGANPFGVQEFENTKEKSGDHRMKRGEAFTIRYRILFHRGDAEAAGIAEAFKVYVDQ